MNMREFKKLLDQFDEDLEVQFTDGNTFKSSIFKLEEMFYALNHGGSRGVPEENLSYDQDDKFTQKVVVVWLDW